MTASSSSPVASSAPPVGVVMPLYNQARFVERAVRSVLAQRMEHFALTVVDDGSTDGGAERVRRIGDPRVQVLGGAHLGPGEARDRGIAALSAPWVALLDADDEWDAGFLERTFRVAESTPEVALVFTGVRVDGGSGSGSGVAEGTVGDYYLAQLVHHVAMTSSSVLFSRQRFLELGGYAPGLIYAEDIHLWLRFACDGGLYYLPERLVSIHRDGGNSGAIGPMQRVTGLDAVLALYETLRAQGRVPAPMRRHAALFMHNLQALRALQLMKLGRRREALRALALRTHPTRFNRHLYLECARAALARGP